MYHIKTEVYTDWGMRVSVNTYCDPADAVIGLANELCVNIEYPVLKHIKKKERKNGNTGKRAKMVAR